MRLISQNGNLDIPYEQVAIQRFKEKIYFLNKNLTGVEQLIDDMEIASYSTEAKAIKAMEMLRDAYAGKLICQNVDLSDDKVVEIMKNWNMGAITVANTDATRVDYINNTVFRFPKDEEIEVEE